ncbi:MAG: radical SAM protein [Planctomycetes bacterium]|uniref:radical SAM protein n=1 Tax=Candidatus Wunengus sp. YC65 TaxID=3367701 RepID=UPI001D570990|nr:radical SAM protein [Planctomycetota bacterium]
MDPALFPQAELRFLVCRLSTYRDVSPSISHGLVAQIAQEVEGVFTDFAFLPPPKDTEVMTTSKIPLWVGTTTKEPPCSFDVLGISNSVVLELLNLPKLLHFSGIPLFKNERMMRQEIPIVVLGGASAAVTSVLHGPIKGQGFGNSYGLVDAVLIGEGEFSIKQFLEVVKKGKSAGLTKAEILNACHGKVDGFYEPDKYEHQYKVVVKKPEKAGKTSSQQDEPLMNLRLTKKSVLDEGQGDENTPPLSPPSQGGEGGVENPFTGEEVLVEIAPTEPYVSFPVKSAIVYDLDQARTMESGPVWYEEESLGTGSLQISNGCPCFCAFCAESWERKPYRERSLSKLLEALRSAKAHQGLDTINFLSFNFNTHAELYSMILSFYEEMANVSLKSQRFDLLSADQFLAEVQQIIGKTTVSCGMEGISERLRRCLHKNLTEEQIYKACEFLFERGIRELKIFLIGTGLEQAEDFGEFGRFVERLADLKSMSDSKVRIIFSLTPLYYPPHTPLQYHACITAIEDNKKLKREIERICKLNGMEFRESASYEETWLMQLFAMGDRRLTPALIRSSITDGFVYYNTVPKQVLKNWRTYLSELVLSEENYFREKGKEQVFPWDDVDMGISKKFLWEEYERSIHFTEREYCLGRPSIDAQCLGCGACPTATHIKKITQHKISQPFLLEELQKIANGKRNLITLRVVVEIEPTMRLAPKRLIGVAIARALMLAMPEIVPYYSSLSGHLSDFTGDKATADFTYGINVYHLAFLSKDRLKELLNNEVLSEKLNTIQGYCQGFRIKEFVVNPGDILDVKYMLYKMYFNKNFTASFIEQKLGEYLHANYVKHTLLKRHGDTIFKVDTKSKKNAMVLYARINNLNRMKEPDAEFSILMAVARRFDIQTFLETCYGFERRREVVCTKIEALGYYGKNPVLQKNVRCASCTDYVNETFLVGQPLGENQCLICTIDRDENLIP